MHNYIRCPTCNEMLSDIYDSFQLMKKIKHESMGEKKNKNANIIPEEDYMDIFEILHIKNNCCRTRLSMVKLFNASLYEDYNE